MLQLLIGLVIFLGIHSLRMLTPQQRLDAQKRWGGGYKAAYALASVLGLYFIAQGYSQMRLEPMLLWSPPRGMQHATILLMWLSMVLLVATYMPINHIKSKLKHPMILSVKVWALAHLLSNGTLADGLLFVGFLVWSVLLFRTYRRQARSQLHTSPAGKWGGTVLSLLLGTALWAAFLMGGLHLWLIGVMPFSRSL